MNKAEKTRQFIIEKTAPLFNMKGFAGTSLSDMTEATGLTKGSIYGNFANKDEVALASFEHNVGIVSAYIRERMDTKHTIREKLMVYVDTYSGFPGAPFPKGGCAILNTAVDADDTHPRLKDRACGKLENWKNRLMVLVQAGIDNGELKAETDPEQVALTIIAILEGGVMLKKVTGKPEYMSRTAQHLKNYLLQL